jgi:uncharacterized tellurite resistance protein B-like protein
MPSKEFVSYLANLMMISKADGSVSKEEQAAIARVYKEIKANKTDLEEAKTITEKGDYQVTPVGRYSERIRNLEDMIFVALSDSALSDTEKSLIRSFARETGAKQEQIDTILSEAVARFRTYKGTITCPNCGHEIPSDWKFCTECGAGTQAQTEPPPTHLGSAKDEILEDSPEEKGLRFEKYVLHRFNLNHCKIREWRGDKFTNGIYAESSRWPDIEVEFSFRDARKTFAVECKWRSRYFKNGVEWAREDQICNYKRYSEEHSIPVFVVIGIGKHPENPKDVFVIPLDDLSEPFLSSDFLGRYRRLDKDKPFFFDLRMGLLS